MSSAGQLLAARLHSYCLSFPRRRESSDFSMRWIPTPAFTGSPPPPSRGQALRGNDDPGLTKDQRLPALPATALTGLRPAFAGQVLHTAH